jgi:uracil-DNA glycosylase
MNGKEPVPNMENSLAALQARASACRLCLEAGYDIYPRAIFSGGQAARLMIIGQAPGITEKEAGRPFNAGAVAVVPLAGSSRR